MPWEPWAQGHFLKKIAFGGLQAVGFASPDLTKLLIREIGQQFFFLRRKKVSYNMPRDQVA